MKKLFCMCAAILCSQLFFAGNKYNRAHPDRATHYIKGNFSARMVDGKPVYELNDVNTLGITFAQSPYYEGNIDDDMGDLKFTFDSARTTYPGGFAKNELAFWYYDKEIGEWQPDIEIRQATGSFENRKIMTIMLVLDCSTSLDKDSSKVKSSAKYFLKKLHDVSNTGNVRVGIIGFSSLAKTKESISPIQPLTDTNYNNMLSFINRLGTANGTALYYSIDTAVTMMKNYANSLKGEEYDNYTRSCLVTFTDGIDQTSQAPGQGILNADAYYEKVKNEIIGTPIKGHKVDNYIVAVKGIDITSDAMITKFDRVLSGITDNYMKIAKFSELEKKFGEIADNLINSWQVLNCYVPAARQGLVCWTLGEEKVKEEVVRERRMLLGLQAGIGVPIRELRGDGYYSSYVPSLGWKNWGLDFQVGFDMVYPIKNNFGLGFYFNIGNGFMISDPDIDYQRYCLDNECSLRDVVEGYRMKFTAGIEITIGDIKNKGALLLGFGSGVNYYDSQYYYSFKPGHTYDRTEYNSITGQYERNEYYEPPRCDYGYYYSDIDVPIEIRIGGVFKNGLYFFGSFSYDFYYEVLEPSLHFGYNFGNLFKVK